MTAGLLDPAAWPAAIKKARDALGWRWFFARTAAWCTFSGTISPFASERVPGILMRYWCDDVVRSLGITLLPEGLEHTVGVGPTIIVANHNSLMDIPIIGACLDLDYKWVSKRSIFYFPFIGWHLRAAGHIWVDRRRRDNMKRLEAQFARVLGNGSSVLLFPEGTRSEDGTLGQYKKGAFITAVRENVPILPIVVNGTEKIITKGSMRFPDRGGLVQLKVLPPILPTADGDFDDRVAGLRDRSRVAMVDALDELRGSPGAAERPTL